MKEKILSIELLKFFAVIVVANSHMDTLYGEYSALATGGAIGDALFFFVSGFTIFLGRYDRFDNWYKRRIKRIYPSIIAWAIVLSFTMLAQLTPSEIVFGAGYWFINCIMLYYVALWFIRRFFMERPAIPIFVSIAAIALWYIFEDSGQLFMYGETYFKWLFNFMFMLVGAYIGVGKISLKNNLCMDCIILVLSIFLYYGVLFMAGRYPSFAHYQIVSLMPLLSVVVYAYKLCCDIRVDSFMNKKVGLCIQFISGLCLEAYIVQVTLIPLLADRIGHFFPANIIIAFITIIMVAYLTRCLARIFTQIFSNEDMGWYAIFKPVP